MSPSHRDRIEQSPGGAILQRPRRIFVVEHYDLILRLLERWLGEAGYSVIVGTPQSLARAVDEGGKPDLVIIDIPTPRSAEEIVKSVRKIHAGPILALSARFRQGTVSSISVGRQLGVHSVLPKPFTRGELLAAVSESIDGR